MPELPEVETVRQTLRPALGFAVTGCKVGSLPLRQVRPNIKAIKAAARGELRDVRRIGKYLILDFSASDSSLLVHLGMSGRLRLADDTYKTDGHTHLVLRLEKANQKRMLFFRDPRRFGQLEAIDGSHLDHHPSLAKLGPDPLEDDIDNQWFYDSVAKRSAPLKSILLDQRFLAGIGNIYASEALWRAKIHPAIRGNTITRRRSSQLLRGISSALEDALTRGGTSLRDFVNADGEHGDNSSYLKVYGRTGEPCRRPHCKGTIQQFKQSNRSSFFCPSCQPENG